jgi:hypothetical protein
MRGCAAEAWAYRSSGRPGLYSRTSTKKHGSGKTKPDPSQILEFTNARSSGQEYQAQLMKGLVEARKRIVWLAGLLQHSSFHHEGEWRLVLPISPNKDKANLVHPIRFRSTITSLIPYIEFPLKHFALHVLTLHRHERWPFLKGKSHSAVWIL